MFGYGAWMVIVTIICVYIILGLHTVTRYLAVTTCNAQMWERYGLKMAQTFAWHWPIRLMIYTEGFEVDPKKVPPRPCRYDCTGCAVAPDVQDAVRRPQIRGMVNGKYDYHWDAVKFTHKVAAIGAAAEGEDCDVLIWMDADIVTHRPGHDRVVGSAPAALRDHRHDRAGKEISRMRLHDVSPASGAEGYPTDRDDVPNRRDF